MYGGGGKYYSYTYEDCYYYNGLNHNFNTIRILINEAYKFQGAIGFLSILPV